MTSRGLCCSAAAGVHASKELRSLFALQDTSSEDGLDSFTVEGFVRGEDKILIFVFFLLQKSEL
jgi:hypothetical protein